MRPRLQAPRTFWWVLVPITLTGLVYTLLLATSLGPLNGFWSTDQGTKLIQTQSLLLTKYRTNALIYPGAPFDPDGVVSPLRRP
jgi:NADH:ubiquinone oxidoreductase subunit 5 (subunit L)/multisubunit Na+/H+ antiporter MnhA subunit